MKVNTKHLFNKNFTSNLITLIGWLVRVTPESTLSIKILMPLLNNLDRIYTTRGEMQLIQYCKNCRLALHRFLSGNPVANIQGIKLTNDGIPVIFGDLIPKIRSKEGLRVYLLFLNTILFSTRSLKPYTVPDLEPIVKSAETPFELDKLNPYQFWKELGYNPSRKLLPRSLKWKYFHFSTKSGPNGHALGTALRDLVSLPDSLRASIKYIGGRKLTFKMEVMEKYLECVEPNPPSPGIVRKLTHVPDKEGKARVVAILDYYSQTSLLPLHKYLFKALKKIPQDCTFDQGSFLNKIDNFEVFHSIDLKSATDRFPISFVSQVLRGLLPEEYVSHWENIMIGEPFWAWTGEQVSYGVGNPMGAYTSWNSFTLGHHYIIFHCCNKLQIDYKTAPYIMLGDDLVIGRDDLAEEYTKFVLSLGVEISKDKSHVSKDFFEFAKRYVYKGEEVTHFPVSALRESLSRYYNMIDLFIDVDNRGWVFNLDIPNLIADIYGSLLNRPSKFRRKIYHKSYLCERVAKAMRGLQAADVSFNEIVRYLNLPHIQPMDEYSANAVMSYTIMMLFAESNPENHTPEQRAKAPPLGVLAETLVTELSTPRDTEYQTSLAIAAIHAHPILQTYSKYVEQEWLAIKRKAHYIDTKGGGNWVGAMKAITIPQSDRVFSMRARKTVMLASSMITIKLVENLRSPLWS